MALFVSEVSDHDVRAALNALGARPSENLTEDSWNARKDPNSHEPDKRVGGTAIDIFAEWKGRRVPLADGSFLLRFDCWLAAAWPWPIGPRVCAEPSVKRTEVRTTNTLGSESWDAAQIRGAGFSTNIPGNGELRYHFSPRKSIPDECLFSGIYAELRVKCLRRDERADERHDDGDRNALTLR